MSTSFIASLPPSVPVVKPVEHDHSPMRDAFQNAIGGLFYGEMLKAMRAGDHKVAYLDGGSTEKLFKSQMDQQIADELSKQPGNPLVDSLYRRFLDGRTAQGLPNPTGTANLQGGGFRQGTAAATNSSQAANSAQLAGLAELSRQTQSARNISQFTTATTAIPGLLRK